MNKNLEVGSRVTISTHGSNVGTVKGLNPKGYPSNTVVVHMDGEPGPRLCKKENVFLLQSHNNS